MKYFLQRRESVAQGVRRIATCQIEAGIAELSNPEEDRHEAIHSFRKRCKKIRALLRVVRPYLGDAYRRENVFFRDLSRQLSGLRDAHALIDALERLGTRFGGQLSDQGLVSIRKFLDDQRDRLVGTDAELEQQLQGVVADLKVARERVLEMHVSAHGFEAIRPGLLKTYRRAQKNMCLAYKTADDHDFHQWRKRVKYHWYHTRLLRRLAPNLLTEHRRLSSRLAELLGQDHDYAVLRQTVIEASESQQLQAEDEVRILLGLIAQRQTEIRAEAWKLGQYLLAEKPRQLGKRWESYWHTWHDDPSPPSRLVIIPALEA